MELINPRTFLVVANLLGLLCALVLWVQARSFPDDILGLRDWARAVFLIACASGLASMRAVLPDAVAIILASGLLLLGQFLLVIGLLRFNGREPHWRPTLDAIGAVLIVITWLTYGSHSYQGRIFLMALAHIGFFSFGAVLAWQAEPKGFGSRFLSVVFLLGAAIAIWRLTTLSATVVDADEIFDYSLIQQVYLGMFSLGVLGLSIGFILLANDRLRVELEFMATRDPMTGLFNRRAFFARAETEWARSLRSGRPLAVITSDIDFFKKINDSRGHHVGDLVIKDYATRSARTLRLPDILARFGGEEFVLLLPDTALDEALQVAERIRQDIADHREPALPPYTVSLGVAVAQGKAGQAADIQALIAEADAALYRAKQRGRNRVET
ncbi:MAG: GGDEF domain-containing protein [Gammaproteobacteria bacterium]|nr:GGDEF domain-containing protein [Gammaproteobacteria bacterium]MBU1646026.1 GGDEF domain-containing protein [Gammaproteobacteria bacterium]MBU1972088.1 GGDEF domain-containing protein [Gammaproteobacteria bacterium]